MPTGQIDQKERFHQSVPFFLSAVWLLAGTSTACSGNDNVPAQLGPACTLLQQAANKAAKCDSKLDAFPEAPLLEAGERECQNTLRRLIRIGRNEKPINRIRSLYEPLDSRPDEEGPLSQEELKAFSALKLPAQLIVIPQEFPVPGVPETSGTLGKHKIAPDKNGHLKRHSPPGKHQLSLRYADKEKSYCIQLDSCEPLKLSAIQVELAPHPKVKPGPCPEMGVPMKRPF